MGTYVNDVLSPISRAEQYPFSIKSFRALLLSGEAIPDVANDIIIRSASAVYAANGPSPTRRIALPQSAIFCSAIGCFRSVFALSFKQSDI